MAGTHVLLYLSHFIGTVLIINILNSILPQIVTNCFLQLSKILICACVTQLTLGISKVIFFNEKLKPDRKAILITGCARGIGNALAKLLDKKGFHVFASCRDSNSPGAEALRRTCSNRLKVLQLDVTDDKSIQKAVQFVKDNLGACELWAIINNAGIQKGFLLDLSSLQECKDTLEVNALGPVRVTKAFLPMLRLSRGRVINMASMIGRFAVPMLIPYTMSKFACVGFSESLRYELDLWGVKVISIEPELFETDMTARISQGIDAMRDKDVHKDYGEEFFRAYKSLSNTFFSPSPNLGKVVETVECAVIAKYPDAVYKVCRNVGVRAVWIFWEVLPAEFKVFIGRITFHFLNFPKMRKTDKSVRNTVF